MASYYVRQSASTAFLKFHDYATFLLVAKGLPALYNMRRLLISDIALRICIKLSRHLTAHAFNGSVRNSEVLPNLTNLPRYHICPANPTFNYTFAILDCSFIRLCTARCTEMPKGVALSQRIWLNHDVQVLQQDFGLVLCSFS